jgi:hypothetical protein
MRKITLIILPVLFFVVISCNKDKDDNETITTVVQDKNNISATFENTLGIFTELRDGAFVKSLFEFLNLSDGIVQNESWINTMSDNLGELVTQDVFNSDGRFLFSSIDGDYTWNISSQSWSKTSSSDIILRFPAKKTSRSNNCIFAISNYSDASYTVNGDLVYLPTNLESTLTKDGINIMSLSADINYASSGFPVPILANIELFLSPTSFNGTFKRVTDTQFESQVDIVSSDYTTSLYAKVSIAHNDYGNLGDDDFNSMQIDFIRGDLNVSGSWDIKTYNNLSAPNTDQLNSTIDFILSYKGEKIGDIKFKDVGNETMVFVFYKDETSENMSIYYEPFLSDFEAAFSSYFGYNFID